VNTEPENPYYKDKIMTELTHLKFEKANGVARITLDRPKFNMMNIEMMDELNGRFEALLQDDELKCIVLYARQTLLYWGGSCRSQT